MSLSDKAAKRILLSWGLWSCLGFYRGIQYDNYWYEKKMKDKDAIYIQSHPKLYSKAFVGGVIGTLLYATLVPSFILIPKEIYRAEIVLRGLEKNRHYYELM
jgi:hypothetical protein